MTQAASTVPGYLYGFNNQLVSNASDYVHQRITRALCPHEMRVLDRTELQPHLRMLQFSSLAVIELHYGSQVEIYPDTNEDLYLFRLTLDGHGLIDHPGRKVFMQSGGLTVTSPGDDAVIRIEPDCHNLLLRVSRAALEKGLQERLGRGLTQPLRFEDSLAPAHPGIDFVRNTIQYMAQVSRSLVASVTADAQIAHLERYLFDSLLTQLPHNYQASLNHPQMPLPAHLKRARALIMESGYQIVPLSRLAAHCGVSSRTLQYSFQKFIGCRPREYMERRRFRAVRDALLAAPYGSRVTDIFAEFEVNSPGHFTRRYREYFGETPSMTLRGSDRPPE